jgi:hypothetical protein
MGQASASEHRFGVRIGAPTSGDATATTPAGEVDIELDSASTAVIFYEYHGADRFDKDNPDPWFFDLGWLLHVGVGATTFESHGVDLEHTHLSVGVGASMNIGRYLFVDVWPQLMVGEAEIQGYLVVWRRWASMCDRGHRSIIFLSVSILGTKHMPVK